MSCAEPAASALDRLYRAARATFDADPTFADRARARVVALQADDEATVASWRAIVAESEFAFEEIYNRLVTLMVRKKDGGCGYDTTDLATIRYRIRDLKATNFCE